MEPLDKSRLHKRTILFRSIITRSRKNTKKRRAPRKKYRKEIYIKLFKKDNDGKKNIKEH